MKEDIDNTLKILQEFVELTADRSTPLFPLDLNTTNEVITELLDYLFSLLDRNTSLEFSIGEIVS